jgi:hypothetical protein
VANTVLILGAGASRKAGAPLMADFLDVANDLWKRGQVDDVGESFSVVFRGISTLQRVHSKSVLDINNVESVFASFEMARILRRFADYQLEEVDALVEAMRVLIVRTIEHTLLFPQHGGRLSVPEPYSGLPQLTSFLTTKAVPKHSVALITFNYDLAADFAFSNSGVPITYALESEDTQHADATPLLKLHGSLNWGWCDTCSRTVPWMLSDYMLNHRLPDAKRVRLPVGSQISKYSSHGHPLRSEPVLIPPSWNKSAYRGSLQSVWARAAHELSEAENLIVCGYSLPPSDEFFKYLYALGTVGDVPLKRYWVFDPDPAVETRFTALLGPGASQRFAFHEMQFHEVLPFLLEQLGPSPRRFVL